jgi:hypothetical protein
MTAERVARLTALGFAWEGPNDSNKGNTDDAGWEAQLAEVGVSAGRDIIGIVRREARRPAGSGAAVESANGSDGEWRAAPWRRKAARRAGQVAAGGGEVEEVAAGPADRPGGRGNGTEWEAQLARLAAYKAARGDCKVPKRWAEDPRLATWVNNQRVWKRKLDRGEPSLGMTVEWAARLTALGFEWDPGSTVFAPRGEEWEAQLARLAAYKAAHGDCNVLHRWAEDPKPRDRAELATWVYTQRTLKRKMERGEH